MEKKTFLNRFNSVDSSIVSGIYDKIVLAKKANRTIYTADLYTPNIWKPMENISGELGIGVHTNGIFEDAERKIIAFSYDEVLEYPISLIKITCKDKFNKLKHKDYLGAVMSLGIKREKFGDLILKNDECYLVVQVELSDYIRVNLKSVSRCTCAVSVLDTNITEIPVYDFQTNIVNVSSLRIDCVVSSLCNTSRSKVEELIRQGKVLVDYSEVLRKDKMLKRDCIVTVRGYGKFKIIEEAGWTGSGRIKIVVKKFI